MKVKFYWKKKSKEWATAPYTPKEIDQEDFVREYECKNITEAWKKWALDSNQKVSRMKYESYAVKETKTKTKIKTYQAEFEDNEIEVFSAISNDEAIKEAFTYEKNHGIVFSVTLIDENYNEVEVIF